MRKPKAPPLVTVLVFTTVTIVIWIFSSVYRALAVKPGPKVPPEILTPIDPTLDTKALEQLENRIFFEEGQITEFTKNLPTPSPQGESATPSPEPTVQEEE